MLSVFLIIVLSYVAIMLLCYRVRLPSFEQAVAYILLGLISVLSLLGLSGN